MRHWLAQHPRQAADIDSVRVVAQSGTGWARPAANDEPPGAEEAPAPMAPITSLLPQSSTEAAWSGRAKALAAAALTRAKNATDPVQTALHTLLSSPEAAGARVGLVVRDGATEVFAHAPTMALNPASNSKLLAARFALDVLTPAHRFETEVLREANGVYVMRGGFDPSLDDAALDAIVASLPDGCRIALDTSRLSGPRQPAGLAQYGDQDWDYLATPEALAYDKNLVQGACITCGSRCTRLARGEHAGVCTSQRCGHAVAGGHVQGGH